MTAAVATPAQAGIASVVPQGNTELFDGHDTRYLSLGYAELLRDVTIDETWGITFLAGVVERRPLAPREQAFMSVLVAMERGMQALLVRLLKKHGIAWDEAAIAAEAEAIGKRLADRFGFLPWREFIQTAIADPAPPYLSKYGRARELAPPADHEILDLLVEHEQALLDVATLELALMSDAALAPMWRCLEKAQTLLWCEHIAELAGTTGEPADADAASAVTVLAGSPGAGSAATQEADHD